MNREKQLLKTGIAGLLALLMAGSMAQMLLAALGLPCQWTAAYLPALFTALLCFLAGVSTPMAVIAPVAGAVVVLTGILTRTDIFRTAGLWLFSQEARAAADSAQLMRAGQTLAAAVGAVSAPVIFVLVNRGGTPFALLGFFATMITSCAMSEATSFAAAAPGLLAAVAALAFSGEVQRDAASWRVLVCSGLVVILALALTPDHRVTWAPLEELAQRIRATVEEYLQFTEERVPFTISTEGYNHAVEVKDQLEARLGGPATPVTDPALRVSSEAPLLLRGTIRRTYTGHSWTDVESKARYLYYDPMRARVREDVFGLDAGEVLTSVQASVEMLDEGPSTLFVPGWMDDFSMSLETAVYFNSIGEIFLSRKVTAGDTYSMKAYLPADESALREAVGARHSHRGDDRIDEIQRSCTQLPNGIEEGVYSLTMDLTRTYDNGYDKAKAIEHWLENHCRYTLTPDYPDESRDFVSQFVLDGREGYCSYFASAMTVMCRIAGLPARYVEGYQAPAGEGIVLTGENAHAWTEVYFNGLGWVPFDAANGHARSDDGLSGESPQEDSSHEGDADPTVPPPGTDLSQSPTPTVPPPDADDSQLPPQQTPEPENSPGHTPHPQDQQTPPAEDPPSGAGRQVLEILLWILLILLLSALAVMWTRRRLEKTDPVRMSVDAPTAQMASLILYRSILTLLAQTGQVPMNGETPGKFARRINAQTTNPDFVVFSDAVALNAYARKPVDRSVVVRGRRAYAAFMENMSMRERLRFAFIRLTRGLGTFENIP